MHEKGEQNRTYDVQNAERRLREENKKRGELKPTLENMMLS
jgi:hypothetical protein